MGQLADRIAEVMRGYGFDPAARQSELHALAALEERDAKAALERFHGWKRELAAQRRSQLLAELRGFPFVADLPPHDTKGWPLKEIEADVRDLGRALAVARRVAAALEEESSARASLRERALPALPPLPPARFDALRPVAAEAERRRRDALREARVEARALDARRRAARLPPPLRIEPPETAALPAEEADAALAAAEEALAAAEAVAAAHEAAVAPLRDAAVRERRRASRRALGREAESARAARDVEALDRIRAQAEALRAEAAREEGEARRARRSGAAGPPRERGAGDTMDGYG